MTELECITRKGTFLGIFHWERNHHTWDEEYEWSEPGHYSTIVHTQFKCRWCGTTTEEVREYSGP